MILPKLVLRNIFSHKQRNIIISLVITFVVSMLFIFLSFSDGEIENINKSIMGLENPGTDIVIKLKGYMQAKNANEKEEELDKMVIQNYPQIIKELKRFDFIKNIYVKTVPVFQNIYVNNNKFQDFAINGLESDNSSIIKQKLKIIEGHFFEKNEENVILIHNEIRKDLNVNIGDTVTIIGTDLFGQTVIQDFNIIGFYVPIIDNPENLRKVFADMTGYNMISGLFAGEANAINIDLNKNNSINIIINKLTEWADKNNHEIEFNPFSIINEEDLVIYEAFRLILIFISLIIILVIMIGIMNIISVNLQDRKKEIGSYYCLGAEKRFLIYLYSFEILTVNAFSTIFGILVGLLIRFIINSIKYTTRDPGMQLVFGSDKFYLGLSISTILYIFIGIVSITLLTSVKTLNTSLKVSPSEAIREVEE